MTADRDALEAFDEITRLRQWKREALIVLDQWNAEAEAVAVAVELDRLYGDLNELRAWQQAALDVIDDLDGCATLDCDCQTAWLRRHADTRPQPHGAPPEQRSPGLDGPETTTTAKETP